MITSSAVALLGIGREKETGYMVEQTIVIA